MRTDLIKAARHAEGVFAYNISGWDFHRRLDRITKSGRCIIVVD